MACRWRSIPQNVELASILAAGETHAAEDNTGLYPLCSSSIVIAPLISSNPGKKQSTLPLLPASVSARATCRASSARRRVVISPISLSFGLLDGGCGAILSSEPLLNETACRNVSSRFDNTGDGRTYSFSSSESSEESESLLLSSSVQVYSFRSIHSFYVRGLCMLC
jgi:hypothetical protein